MPASLKILIFNWRCWTSPDAGGAEVFTHENARRWVDAGHEVTLFTSKYANCRSEEYVDGVRIIRAGGRLSVYWKAKSYYRKLFSHENYDVVIDEINTRPFFAPKFVRRGETVVALIHQLAREYWFYETPFPISYLGYYLLEDRWLKQYVDIPTITVSESTRRDLHQLGFRSTFRVPVGLNMHPLEDMPEKEPFPVMVYVGRLKKAKRPSHALKAHRLVREEVPDAELWVVGEGGLKKSLERVSGEGVRFFNGVSNEERRKLIERAWVLVHPSVREGWGLNVIEANALGTPCVGYAVAGLTESVQNGKTGLLVEDGNVGAMASTLAQTMQDDELRLKLSMNALSYSGLFNWETSAEAFLKTIKRIAHEN